MGNNNVRFINREKNIDDLNTAHTNFLGGSEFEDIDHERK